MKVNVFAIAAGLLVLAAATSAEARRYEGTKADRGWQSSDADDDDDRRRRYAKRIDRDEEDADEDRRSKRRHVAKRTHRTKHAHATQRKLRKYARGATHGSNGRPRKWCGWWMRQQRGGGPELNVAWNWSRWGRPSGPQVGAVVVWRHHVGEIVGQAANGRWLVRSGNDGGKVRTRARSVAGAVFRVG